MLVSIKATFVVQLNKKEKHFTEQNCAGPLGAMLNFRTSKEMKDALHVQRLNYRISIISTCKCMILESRNI